MLAYSQQLGGIERLHRRELPPPCALMQFPRRCAGKRDQLVGRVQERYGVKKDEAEKQVKDWETRNSTM